jgi:hypothetical protein
MPRMELRIREVDKDAGARSKGSNGVVAVGLPHRNSSVFKQTSSNLREVKGRIRMDPRFSARVTYRRGQRFLSNRVVRNPG